MSSAQRERERGGRCGEKDMCGMVRCGVERCGVVCSVV
jgi:hypothetical protein